MKPPLSPRFCCRSELLLLKLPLLERPPLVKPLPWGVENDPFSLDMRPPSEKCDASKVPAVNRPATPLPLKLSPLPKLLANAPGEKTVPAGNAALKLPAPALTYPPTLELALK